MKNSRRHFLQSLLALNGAALVTPMALAEEKKRPEKLEPKQVWYQHHNRQFIVVTNVYGHQYDCILFHDELVGGIECHKFWDNDLLVPGSEYRGTVSDLPGAQR